MGLPWWPSVRLHAPNAGGQGLIPGQETRSHMQQLRPGTAKSIYKFLKKKERNEHPQKTNKQTNPTADIYTQW